MTDMLAGRQAVDSDPVSVDPDPVALDPGPVLMDLDHMQ